MAHIHATGFYMVYQVITIGELVGSVEGVATVSGRLVLDVLIGQTDGVAIVSGTLYAKAVMSGKSEGWDMLFTKGKVE